MKKSIFILAVLTLIAFSMSCVCAENITNADAGHIDELAIDINLTRDGDIVNLENDYISSNTTLKHITIDSSITVDGNDHVIDASDIPRVFFVKADNVVIKNINFVNAKTTGLAGGVISWWGNNGTLINCNFSDNLASSGGGAVYLRGDNATIANCNFINNSAVVAADVSLTCGDGYDPSQPHIMTVNSDGGALYLEGNNISVDNCCFESNKVDFAGGAIKTSWGNNVRISNSKFKNNSAGHNGGAIDMNGENPLIVNSTFINNAPADLFLNSRNATVMDSHFENVSSVDALYDVRYVNVSFGSSRTFDDLAVLISATPEGGVLILEDDYIFVNGTNRGILISKPITIDGMGHTLDGRQLSRIFNITADNVTISNVNFINGKTIAKYFSVDIGAGAIYWNGANGVVRNCNFTDNAIRGIDEDPFDQEEEIITEGGVMIHTIRVRPMGAKVTEGGAIVWNGTNGTVYGCIFENNHVGYANSGGAIYWRGDNGRILESRFYNNEAWSGASIFWTGKDGEIAFSKFVNEGNIFRRDIMWFGENGAVHHCSLLTENNQNPFYLYENVKLDYNLLADVKYDTYVDRLVNLSNWAVLWTQQPDKDTVMKGDLITVECFIVIFEIEGNSTALFFSANLTKTADKNGMVHVKLVYGKPVIEIIPTQFIISKDLSKYYKQAKEFTVRVYEKSGKLAINKKVKFKIGKKTYYRTTNSKGYATLKISFKPGKYTISVQYGEVTLKNKITVKTTLITKNVIKKFKKSGKFTVKVLKSNGKKYAKKVVKIKFKGKIYKIKTNKNGVATFNIPKNLKVGKYTIKTICNGLTNSNRITVKR
ncbi:right-handed parallel beta-helix repeat-containing protein [Methanobrevibacter sp.]